MLTSNPTLTAQKKVTNDISLFALSFMLYGMFWRQGQSHIRRGRGQTNEIIAELDDYHHSIP